MLEELQPWSITKGKWESELNATGWHEMQHQVVVEVRRE